MSTFQGLELSKRALFAQQGGLYTTGHNISNVNTQGYSRQRVNFEATTPFPSPSRNMPGRAGQLGTGVDIGVIDRIRNKFLDMQYRTENSRMGYWETRSEALSRMEELLNEPSENGLNKTMDRFWQSLQDLADNPENEGARSVVAQRGLAVAETFNHLHKSLTSIQKDLKEEIDQSVKDVNKLVEDINELNKQIRKIEPHGMLANDLYDERDRLIDKLSGFMNIKVTYTESSSSSLDIADGLASIQIVDKSGSSFEPPVYLINAKDNKDNLDEAVNKLIIEPGKDTNGSITSITVEDQSGASGMDLLKSTGSISSLVTAHGYQENGKEKGDYPEMIQKLDDMAKAFAEEFNKIHTADGAHGVKVDENGDIIISEEDPLKFFVKVDPNKEFSADNITVNPEILKDGKKIAASLGDSLNNDNVLKLAEIFDAKVLIAEGTDRQEKTSVRDFYNAMIGDMGVAGQEAGRNVENTAILKNQVDNSRMATSAVSLDEEMSNLIKFQHAYNAAARNMTAIDEIIDRIINQMGLVGR